MLLKQKISDELSTCVTKIKHEIANDLFAHSTKIANKLDAKNNTTIIAEIKRILTDVYKKLIAEINTKISNELSTRLSEINTELNDKLTTEIKKINSRDAGYASEAQKLFNDMATRINNIEEACYNNFASVNTSIKALQNGLIQYYTITRRNQPIEADQQSISNHSEASNRSHISSFGSSSRKLVHIKGETIALAIVIVQTFYTKGLVFEVDLVKMLKSIGGRPVVDELLGILTRTKQPKGTIGIIVSPSMDSFTPGTIKAILEIAEPPELLEQLSPYPIIVTNIDRLPKYLINTVLDKLHNEPYTFSLLP
ncbi:1965_t:CDS:2 [Gigaspora margarita]|uniref:1965_t:CDS:1 n=1 Tax=Gigaspora margarita TaxID=4874 RepID=A0ABN7UGC5_GIGMA|nr:1965_t:CDS:2 [Gigaspora margarita]